MARARRSTSSTCATRSTGPKFGLATLTYHEAVPGHHLQVMLALESEDIPLIRRRGFYSGYSEGWALYAEQLADEMGMYEGDPLGQVGYLQSLLFRATRLVVDQGMHAKRWSREKATDYLIATTGIARGRSQGEIDRYTVWPGQACSYKIGHTVWVRLRDEAKAQGRRELRPQAVPRGADAGRDAADGAGDGRAGADHVADRDERAPELGQSISFFGT